MIRAFVRAAIFLCRTDFFPADDREPDTGDLLAAFRPEAFPGTFFFELFFVMIESV